MVRASLTALLAVSALVPACTSEPADEFGDETAADGEGGKADGTGAWTFYNLIPDNRACSLNSPADCGSGFFVSRANRSTIQCGRGPAQSQCKVGAIDWSGTALPASVAQSYEGQPLLVKGDVVPAADDRGLTFAVSEVWVASTPEWAEGVFTVVRDSGIRCITAPCPSLTEQKLNSNLAAASISDLDFSDSGADDDAIAHAREQLYTEDGLIVVGYRYYDGDSKARTVNKFFVKAPTPLH